MENEKTKGVYVYDFYCRKVLKLWNHAKALKSIGYQYVYVKNGKVFCKKNYFTIEQLLRTEDDVDKLLYDATTFMH